MAQSLYLEARATVKGVLPLPPIIRFPILIIGIPKSLTLAILNLNQTTKQYKREKGNNIKERSFSKRPGEKRYFLPQKISVLFKSLFRSSVS